MVCNGCHSGVHCNGNEPCKCACTKVQPSLFPNLDLQSPVPKSERRTIVFIEVILSQYMGRWFAAPVEQSRWLSLDDCISSLEDRAKYIKATIENCGHDTSLSDVFKQVRDVSRIFRLHLSNGEIELRGVLKKVRK